MVEQRLILKKNTNFSLKKLFVIDSTKNFTSVVLETVQLIQKINVPSTDIK